MKYKRDIEATKENPVSLPGHVTVPTKTEDFLEVAKGVMEQHKDTLQKLADSDTTEVAYGLTTDSNGNQVIVEVEYNRANAKLIPTGEVSKGSALERFKMHIQRNLIDIYLNK